MSFFFITKKNNKNTLIKNHLIQTNFLQHNFLTYKMIFTFAMTNFIVLKSQFHFFQKLLYTYVIKNSSYTLFFKELPLNRKKQQVAFNRSPNHFAISGNTFYKKEKYINLILSYTIPFEFSVLQFNLIYNLFAVLNFLYLYPLKYKFLLHII